MTKFAALFVAWLSLLGVLQPVRAASEIAVIVHPNNPVRALSNREVSDLYLGRARSFVVDDQIILASIFEQQADSPLRQHFFRVLNGMSQNQLNAYWARLRFSGEVLPPVSLSDSRLVLDAVSRNRGGIGYIDASLVNNSVKVVLRLKD
jgi:ABC-type phosphate transport system substrate-binding protein